MERPRALHGGGVQQRAAGHRGEHPAGSGLLQQGEVGLSWQPGRMGPLAAPNCPQAVGLPASPDSSKGKDTGIVTDTFHEKSFP